MRTWPFAFLSRRHHLVDGANTLPPVRGRILVVGSGPRAAPPADFPHGWTLATVNASQVISEKWGLRKPDITLMNAAVLNSRPVNREAKAQLFGKSTRNLICVLKHKPATLRLRLAMLLYRSGDTYYVTQERRAELLSEALGAHVSYESRPSSGVTLALMVALQGASEVVMTGFSFEDGHAYNDKNRPRGHADEDRQIIQIAVRKNLPIFTNDPVFAAESRLPLYQGEAAVRASARR